MYDILFEGAQIADGSGKAAFTANLATLSSSIALIGNERVRARNHIDARGLTLVPGFIDIHAHSELYALKEPSVPLRTAQGITSDVSGNCGIGPFPYMADDEVLPRFSSDVLGRYHSPWPWTDFSSFRACLDKEGCSMNRMFLQAHSPLRIMAMGTDTDRAATDEEIEMMCSLLDRSLEEGAMGFSTGLYYQPCFSADDRELEALLRVVKKHDALFAVHMRSEGDDILKAAEEVLSLSLKTGVRLEISHLKVIGRRNEDKLEPLLQLIHSYHDRGLDVGFDAYAYNVGSTSLFSLLPPSVLALSRTEQRFALQLESTRSEMKKAMLDPVGWESIYALAGAGRIRILHLDSRSDLNGLSLEDLADKAGCDPLDALFDVLSEETGTALMSDETESEAVLETILSDELMSFSTDALYSSFPAHPRSHSASIKFLSFSLPEHRILTFEDCIRRMTSINAGRLGLKDRGVVRESACADLVLLDRSRLSCEWDGKANPAVRLVCVNGRIVWQDGQCCDSRAGRILLKNPAR